MPVVIDTLEKLQSAYRVLKSGKGSPEQRAEIEAELNRVSPAIELAKAKADGGVIDYGIKFSELSSSDQQLANDILGFRTQQNVKSEAATLSVAPRGVASSALKIGRAITDLVGWNGASDFLGESREEIERNGVSLAVDRRRRWLGRELSEKEVRETAATAKAMMTGVGFATELGAGIATGGATLGARGLLSGISLGAVEGGAFGYLMAEAEGKTTEERVKDRLGDAALGAVLGGGVGVLTGGAAAVRNLIANQVRRYSNDADEAFKLGEQFGVQLSFGQASGSPVLQGVEARLKGNYAQALMAQQSDTLAQAISNKLKFGLPRIKADIGAELPEKTDAAFAIFDDIMASMNQRGQAIWKKTVKNAHLAATPDEIVLPKINEIKGQLNDIIKQLDVKYGGVEPGRNLRQVQGLLAKIEARGGATIDDVDVLWQKVNAMADDPAKHGFVEGMGEKATDVINTLAGRLRRGLIRQIDGAPKSDAVAILQAGRKAWGANQTAKQDLVEKTLGPLGFGAGRSASQYMDALKGVNVSTMRKTLDRLRKLPGGPLKIREIRSALFEGAVEDAMHAAVRKGAQAGSMDVATFAERLAATGSRSRLAGLLDDKQEKLMREGIALTRRLLNEASQQTGVVQHRLVAGAEELAINLISRDPGFLARLLAGALSRGRGADWLFFTEEGIKVLRSIQPGAYKTKGLAARRNAAIVMLGGFLSDGTANAQEDEVRASMGQQQ